MSDLSNKELLEELGVEAQPKKKAALTQRQERILAGFEEIQRFVEEHGRAPEHGEDKDIFERLYAVRLDRINQSDECRSVVQDVDHQNLLTEPDRSQPLDQSELSDEELLAQLGVDAPKEGDVTYLKHVKPRAEIRAAEEIAQRDKCEDFEKFQPIFETVQKELDMGTRETRPFRDYAEVKQGDLFILSGQKVFVADKGEEFVPEHGRPDSRLRVIYDNGTESNLLMRSLQRALNKDETGRRILDLSPGPLFSAESAECDLASGTIYVLRSLSDDPVIANNRSVIHKIGVTGGDVKRRIANAKKDPTYLLAEVEVVATYELFNINRTKLEKLLHRVFSGARLDISIKDRFGEPVEPREWFLVPLSVIDDVVEKIREGTIKDFRYDEQAASLVSLDSGTEA